MNENTHRFYVYLWRNVLNGKRYVGKGTGNRCFSYLRKSKKAQKCLLTRAILKYGSRNFELFFLEDGLNEIEAFRSERYWIALLKTNASCDELGYNLTDGGEGTSGYRLTLEQRYKISCANSGRLGPNRGKVSTEETRRKLSASLKGRKHSSEHRQRIGAAHRGRSKSEKQRRNQSESMKGRSLSKDHKKKLSIHFSQDQICDIISFYQLGISVGKIAKKFNVSRTPIYRVLREQSLL